MKFTLRWVSLVMKYISFISYSIIIKGQQTWRIFQQSVLASLRYTMSFSYAPKDSLEGMVQLSHICCVHTIEFFSQATKNDCIRLNINLSSIQLLLIND